MTLKILPALNPACSLAFLFSLGFKPIQDDYQHDFAGMTNWADSSVVLAELMVALFIKCNNQRLRLWCRPVSCSPDFVTDLCNINHRQFEQGLQAYFQFRKFSPVSVLLLQARLYIFWGLTEVPNYIVSTFLKICLVLIICCSAAENFLFICKTLPLPVLD